MIQAVQDSCNYKRFVNELDRAERAHMDWTHRVLRCAVLHTLPDDDVLKDNAHQLCEFGHFLERQIDIFNALDKNRSIALKLAHKTMHDGIRAISHQVFRGEPGNEADLIQFEQGQQELIEHLAHFKTLAVMRTAQTDALTGLPLRHHLDADFLMMQQRTSERNSLLVMLADVDHFKHINDQYGHSAGDLLLQKISNAMRHAMRDGDRLYRYGGEEFVILMFTSSNPDDQQKAADRILKAVSNAAITLPCANRLVTSITIGMTEASSNEPLAHTINRADQAMYRGKAAGRNCVVVG